MRKILLMIVMPIIVFAGMTKITVPKATEMSIDNVLKFQKRCNESIWISPEPNAKDTGFLLESTEPQIGWGQMFKPMLKGDTRVKNLARSGASSKSFKPIIENYATECYWGDGVTASHYGKKGVKQQILETDTSKGGLLFIQFGHNDSYPINYRESSTVPGLGNEFDMELMEYIQFARDNNLEPVLVTPMCRMVHSSLDTSWYHRIKKIPDNTPHPYEYMRGRVGNYHETIRKIARREDVLLVDLTQKSKDHFENDFTTTEDIRTAYAWNGSDLTHFNATGAQKMADFIKEEIVAKAPNLAKQFK